MFDLNFIRQNPEKFDIAMQSRGTKFRAKEILALDESKRQLTFQIQELQSRRNQLAKEIGEMKKNGQSTDEIQNQAKSVNAQLEKLTDEANKNNDSNLIEEILLSIPNLCDPSVPIGDDESSNQIIETFGLIRQFDFPPKSHDEIGENLGMLDFERSAQMSGARFSTLTGDLARLERALSNFMLDIALQNGYVEVSPPNLVRSEAMKFSGQLPKFAEEAFSTQDGYWLIPTSEVSLVNFVAKTTFDANQLPLRFTAYTPCYRREAGSAGKDTRGMIRQHQFKKVELVSIVTQDLSDFEHERMTKIACEVLKLLDLPFRKILLCSGDIGFCAQKTYDLEVWLPSAGKYREISSCSNCGDFQARRAKIKYKTPNGKSLFAHTLNGSSLAVGRTLLAVMENYQNQDGSITIPQILQNYFGGQKLIKRQ